MAMQQDHFRKRIPIGSTRVDSLTFSEAVDRIIGLAGLDQSALVVTPNADHLLRLETDAQFRSVYAAAALVVADGMPLVWASWLSGTPLPARVSGADLLSAVAERAAYEGVPIFLLGGPPGIANLAANKLQSRFPGLKIVGAYSPSMGFEHKPEENRLILTKIKRSGARIIFVGVGSPKQELWMHRYAEEIGAGVLMGVGAAIEFAAGTRTRAPLWMQKSGSEWLYRLYQEPKRLFWRYLHDFRIIPILLRTIISSRLAARSMDYRHKQISCGVKKDESW